MPKHGEPQSTKKLVIINGGVVETQAGIEIISVDNDGVVTTSGAKYVLSNSGVIETEAGTDILAVDSSGVVTMSGLPLTNSTETIAAGGTTTALSLAKFHHDIDADAGGDAFTLANGTVGQMVLIVMKTATGDAVITPATFLGGTNITLDAAGDSVCLYYSALGWQIVGGNGYEVA